MRQIDVNLEFAHTCSIQPSEALELSYGAPPRALVHDVSARGVPYRRAEVPVLRQVHLKVRVVVKLPHPQGWASCCFMHLRYGAVRKATRCGILRVTKIQFFSTFIWTIKTKNKIQSFYDCLRGSVAIAITNAIRNFQTR